MRLPNMIGLRENSAQQTPQDATPNAKELQQDIPATNKPLLKKLDVNKLVIGTFLGLGLGLLLFRK